MIKNKTLIKEIFDTDIDPQAQMSNLNAYTIRRAARGIVIKDGQMAVLNVTKNNYHKLPGGGIEKGETVEEAAKREVLEETGYHCEILDLSGMIIEWREQFKLLQISYIFLAKVIGEVGPTKLEQGEIDEGFELEWIPVKEVEEILKNDTPTNYEGKFIQIRDGSVIEYYKDRI